MAFPLHATLHMHDGPYRLPDLGGVTVLLIDHLVEDRGVIASMLDLAGAGVFEVGFGAEAKATIPHLKPDVIVTEMVLPDGSGADLARWIRDYDAAHARNTVAVALTRWPRECPPDRARACGFDGYFVKPPTTDDLIVGVAALLRARKPR